MHSGYVSEENYECESDFIVVLMADTINNETDDEIEHNRIIKNANWWKADQLRYSFSLLQRQLLSNAKALVKLCKSR